MYNSIIFGEFSDLCDHHRNLVLEHFCLPKKILSSARFNPFVYIQPQKTSNLLYIQIECVFWIFHINGVIQDALFSVCPLPLSRMFLRFICVMAYISILSHFCYRIVFYIFYWSIHQSLAIWVVSAFSLLWLIWYHLEHSYCESLWGHVFSFILGLYGNSWLIFLRAQLGISKSSYCILFSISC